MLQNHSIHGRNTEEGDDFISLNMVKETVQINPWEQYECVARKKCPQSDRLAQNMKQRPSLDDDILPLGDEAFTHGPLFSRTFQKQNVRERHSFRETRGATRVQHFHPPAALCLMGW